MARKEDIRISGQQGTRMKDIRDSGYQGDCGNRSGPPDPLMT